MANPSAGYDNFNLPYMSTGATVVYGSTGNGGTLEYNVTAATYTDHAWRKWLLTYVAQMWLEMFAGQNMHEIAMHTLVTGDNGFTETQPITSLVVSLTTTHYEGNLSYGALKYGNYGVAVFFDGAGNAYAPQWLNFPQMKLKAPANDCVEVKIYLKPNVTGSAESFTRIGNNYVGESEFDNPDYNFDPQSGAVHG